VRRLRGKQKTLTELAKVAGQAAAIQQQLQGFPAAIQGIGELKGVLDSIQGRLQALESEVNFLRFIVRQNLTDEEEAEYRQEFAQIEKDRG